MAFVVAGGGALVWRVAHDNYSDYSDWREHSNYREYGDSALRDQIRNKENEISRKESEVENLRRRMNDNFNRRIAELQREKDYPTFYSAKKDIVKSVKEDIRRELDSEISKDKQELEAIDSMIARINEIELQAKR